MENKEHTEPLLKNKVYYKNCPGCKVDQLKVTQHDLPWKRLFPALVIMLCITLPISLLFPFLYFMIRDFHIAKAEEDVGYYAGYVGSMFMLGRAITSVFWGMIADRWGRKPVIVTGTIAVVIFNTLFGLSINFYMAVTTRFLLGSLNGAVGAIMAYASEVCQEEHLALGQASITAACGIGLIIGPAIGGFLAQPAEKYPNIFSEGSLFARFPYFLPCLCVSILNVPVAISSFWLQETLHTHDKTNSIEDDSFEASEALSSKSNGKDVEEIEGGAPTSKKSLIKNWPLISCIIAFSIVSLHDIAYTEIFSLWAVSPRKFGGLSYSTNSLGEVLSVTGFGMLIFQLFVYPFVQKIYGPATLSRICSVLSIPLLQSYPLIAQLSGLSLAVVLSCASVTKNVLLIFTIIGLNVLQNKAVDHDQRGAANGVSVTTMSFFKAVGPAVGGTVFSWAQKRQDATFLPGNQMVFFVLNLVQAMGVLAMCKPFLVERRD